MGVDDALLELLRRLAALGYDFVTPTPLTHQRVLKNRGGETARSLRDVFGWSLPFAPEVVDGTIMELLERADAVVREGGLFRSRYRVSRLCGKLFLHSAYPTTGRGAVFFGPDSYRFVRFVLNELRQAPQHLIDMGAGGGVGGICAGSAFPDARILLVDSNPEALRYARINAAAAGVAVETRAADSIAALGGEIDLLIANPPFLVDDSERAYRHGGAMLGAQLSLDWALAAAERLRPGGRILLYTASAITEGHDALQAALKAALPELDCRLDYDEIDPDIFGEELERVAYRHVERIAAVGIAITKAGGW